MATNQNGRTTCDIYCTWTFSHLKYSLPWSSDRLHPLVINESCFLLDNQWMFETFKTHNFSVFYGVFVYWMFLVLLSLQPRFHCCQKLNMSAFLHLWMIMHKINPAHLLNNDWFHNDKLHFFTVKTIGF